LQILKTIRILLLSILLNGLSLFSHGQSTDLFFHHLTTNDGLSNNTIYSINEDTLGFIWIGTRSGLNRFDGHNFKVYDSNDGLRNVFINTIFRDSKGCIWIGTQGGGISKYDYETGGFTTYFNQPDNPNSLSNDDVQAIVEDSRGNLWIGTHDGGLNKLNINSKTISRIPTQQITPQGFHIDRINTMLLENDSLIWLGTLDGLFYYNPVRNRIQPFLIGGLPLKARILCLYQDGISKLWLGTPNGVVRIDRTSHILENVGTSGSSPISDQVVDIKKGPDGRIMLATDGGGLRIYDPTSGIISAVVTNPNSPNSLSNNSVYTIFMDSYAGLWIGNYTGGINYYSEYDWKFLPVQHEMNNPLSLSDNHIRSFFQDGKGEIWIGTLGGLNHYDPLTGKFRIYAQNKSNKNSLSSNSVLSIYEDHEGLLWVGTFGGGISILDKSRNNFRKFTHPDDLTNSLEKANIYSIIETSGNKLCIASLGGIYLVDRGTNQLKRFMSTNSKLSNNTVKVLCKDRAGNIWAGTNQGLNKFNPETGDIRVFLHSNTSPNSLSNNRILSIIEATDGKLWIGTEGGGVSIFNPGTETFSSLPAGCFLPDNVVNAIIQDDLGRFWLSTNKGLARFDPVQKKVRVYSAVDGLQANEFNQNAAMKARDGKLYFGGINGFNVFSPGTLITNLSPPRVTFTDLYINNKIVKVTDENSPVDKQLFLMKTLTLNYGTSFEINFAALGFVNKGKYLYSYFIKGVNDDWTEFREDRSANYSNLSPGQYTFMVRAMNSDGVQNENPAMIEIRILPPLWKTWWAFILYGIIIAVLLFLLMRFNSSWIRVKNQLLMERNEKEQIEKLNQMKLGFFTNISHEFKTPLTLILGNLDNLKNSGNLKQSETLSNIEKNAQRLLILINQLLEFRKAENGLMNLQTSKGNIVLFISGIKENFDEFARSNNIHFNLMSDENIPDIWFDPEKIEKIVYNLLSNAFKYVNPGGAIVIEIASRNSDNSRGGNGIAGFVEITVRDTGQGISPQEINQVFDRFYQESKARSQNQKLEGSGIGLAYSKKLVEMHHGDIWVKSEEGVGSSFTFKLPVGKDHLRDDEIREDLNLQLKMDYQRLSGISSEETPRREMISELDETIPVLLVVDDNPMICQVIYEKFQGTYQVVTAGDGIEGLEKARKFVPDVIISDILMPGMDGIEFCQRIKEELLTCHIPVILLTAKSGEESQIEGIKTGADAYISKPYNPEILQATVFNLINTRKTLRNKFYGKEQFIPAEVVSNKMDEKFLNKLIQLIEERSEEESVDIAVLCREIAMSRSALYRKLKALTGNSIQDFVRIVKLRKASRMLLESNASIAEIAFQAGFSNTKYFSTAFKKQFGKTPSLFRNQS